MRVVGIELGCLFKSLKIIYRREVKKTGTRAESALMKSPRANIRNKKLRQMSLLDVLISENLTQIGMQRTRARL